MKGFASTNNGQPGNLPAEVTSFVGRKAELRELTALLATTRLLSLVGPGGVGKSRLARRLASVRRVRSHESAWLVDFSPLVDAALVGPTVAGVLQVRERAGRTWADILAHEVGSQPLLLILDNCEHVIDAVAQLAEPLLQRCPALVIVASSREPVDVAGEVVWRVGPLSVPQAALVDLSAVHDTESVQLFVERITARLSDFALTQDTARAVARICVRLGGLPLALELIAACVPSLGLHYIAARLDARYAMRLGGGGDSPPRHQTLHATVDWSYGLLSEPQRMLLRRLAVFVGGWTLDAAEATCADSHLPPALVADLLDQLVKRSLVLVDHTTTPARYRFPESVRVYASDVLEASGEADTLRGEHARYTLVVASSVHPARLDARHALRLDQEQGNVRAALRWTLRRSELFTACRLAIASFTFWLLRARYAEGRAWLAQCLALPVNPTCSKDRASVGCMAGHMALLSGDCAGAEVLLTTSLDAHRGLDHHPGIVLATHGLALVALRRGDLVEARALCEGGFAALRQIRSDDALTRLLRSALTTAAAQVAWEQADERLARALTRDAEVLARTQRNLFWLGRALQLQALAATADRRPAVARALTEQATASMRDRGDTEGLLDALCMHGHLELDRGRVRQGEADFVEAVRLAEQSGARLALISALEGIARARSNTQPAEAVRLVTLCGALREALGCSASPGQKRRNATWLARARAVLSPSAFGAANAPSAGGQSEAVRLARELVSGDAASLAIDGSPLTPRESEVAGLLGQGLSNKRIAGHLSVSVGTVRSHVDHILLKLGLHSRAQVAIWSVRREAARR